MGVQVGWYDEVEVVLSCGCGADVTDMEFEKDDDGMLSVSWVAVEGQLVRSGHGSQSVSVTEWGYASLTVGPHGEVEAVNDDFEVDDYELDGGDWEIHEYTSGQPECRSCGREVSSARVYVLRDETWLRWRSEHRDWAPIIGHPTDELGDADGGEVAVGVHVEGQAGEEDGLLGLLRDLGAA